MSEELEHVLRAVDELGSPVARRLVSIVREMRDAHASQEATLAAEIQRLRARVRELEAGRGGGQDR